VRAAVQTLNPGYFALVMATGIVSIAMQTHRAYAVSIALLWLTVIEYAVLIVVYVLRLAGFRTAVLADLSDPARAFGYFTFVAATDVLGTCAVPEVCA
jgi:tellurite resistance protein TehA-like permease